MKNRKEVELMETEEDQRTQNPLENTLKCLKTTEDQSTQNIHFNRDEWFKNKLERKDASCVGKSVKRVSTLRDPPKNNSEKS